MFDGTNSRRFWPILEQEPTIDRMMVAILQNEEEVSIPWNIGPMIHFMKMLFSSSVQDWLGSVLAGDDLFDNFKGRQGTSAPIN